jgi:hypothetical protein
VGRVFIQRSGLRPQRLKPLSVVKPSRSAKALRHPRAFRHPNALRHPNAPRHPKALQHPKRCSSQKRYSTQTRWRHPKALQHPKRCDTQSVATPKSSEPARTTVSAPCGSENSRGVAASRRIGCCDANYSAWSDRCSKHGSVLPRDEDHAQSRTIPRNDFLRGVALLPNIQS